MERAGTLLVVDDDADNRDLLSRRLEHEGWSTRQAESGEQALEVVRRGGHVSVEALNRQILHAAQELA